MVCPYVALVGERATYADRPMLGGVGRVASVSSEFVATRNAGDLFPVLLIVRQRRAGFFRLPIRRDAARSRIYCFIFCSRWISPRYGCGIAAIARQFVSAAMGVVSYLLRVGRREDYWWRSRVAEFYGDG